MVKRPASAKRFQVPPALQRRTVEAQCGAFRGSTAVNETRKIVDRLRHATAAALLAGAALSGAAIAQGAADVKLFKVITSRDEIVVGLTAKELQGLGGGAEVERLAKRIVDAGQMTVWQYATRKDAASGNLQQAPLRKVAVLKSETLRIEPYATPLAILPPAE
jgi:hypothetical protein